MTWGVFQYAEEQTKELIGYYGDESKDEADIIEETIDAIQENVGVLFNNSVTSVLFLSN